MTYLLDTNVWVTVLRHPSSALSNHFQSVVASAIRTCSVVVAELRHGCLRSVKPTENRTLVDALLAPYICLDFDDAAAEEFANIRFGLEQVGLMIGPYDIQIASIARANNCVLVTHNTSEFSRVPGLLVEDWQIP